MGTPGGADDVREMVEQALKVRGLHAQQLEMLLFS